MLMSHLQDSFHQKTGLRFDISHVLADVKHVCIAQLIISWGLSSPTGRSTVFARWLRNQVGLFGPRSQRCYCGQQRWGDRRLSASTGGDIRWCIHTSNQSRWRMQKAGTKRALVYCRWFGLWAEILTYSLTRYDSIETPQAVIYSYDRAEYRECTLHGKLEEDPYSDRLIHSAGIKNESCIYRPPCV